MNKYNIYAIIFSFVGGQMIGLTLGYNAGLISSVILYFYAVFKLGLNKVTDKTLIQDFKFTQ